MKIKLLNISKLTFFSVFTATVLMVGCNGNNGNVEDQIEDSVKTDNLSDEFNKAKQVIYGIPSPIETAMLMKRAGAKYNQDYLNPLLNVGNYTTTKSMSLNLGIYSTDLSFASMFEQSQSTIKYLSATKKLADELGILNAIDKSIITRLENNVNNRDSSMEIISETFMNSNSFLKENDRGEIAAIILTGGWLEGLYIGCLVAKNTASNKEMIERIADQRLSLNTLISLMNEYKNDPNVQSILPDMERLKTVFDKIQTSSSNMEVVEKDGKSIISSKSEVKVSTKVFNEICETITEIRTNIIK
ncbi:MAG: hypothetical protein COX07_03160 [Bacteroidetes bacterium CG23_combo_of_CG06-09_8_20_14_all_32_9]|nr:MAG: hypothetical protein COX07_03160 [Bacteroidetes bacterium CG23_combo_of_CG06-09_8_20_14_all_32_9]